MISGWLVLAPITYSIPAPSLLQKALIIYVVYYIKYIAIILFCILASVFINIPNENISIPN